MCEITALNYEEKYLEIMRNMKDADFLTLDLEFSGLGVPAKDVSLFDDPEERYAAVREKISDLLVLQMGISALKYERFRNYRVATYTFYLYPRSFPYINDRFMCETKSLQFLAEQTFDFNKVFKHGLTYALSFHEQSLRREIETGRMLAKLKEDLDMEEARNLNNVCKDVFEWLLDSKARGQFMIDLRRYNPILRYLMRQHIETHMKLKSSYLDDHVLKIEKGERSQDERNDELLDILMGATRIVQEIVALRKPIVGHNMMMDLMMFYKSFFDHLPSSYVAFKREMIKIFPEVYDTKVLAFELRKKVRDLLDSPFNLRGLFQYFLLQQQCGTYPDMPKLYIADGFEYLRENFHDSGYDSYCTGFIYLQLAHIFSMWDEELGTMGNVSSGNSPHYYLKIVETYRNRIHMIRGRYDYFCLDGDDPDDFVTNMLLVEANMGEELDAYELIKLCAKHDSADVKPVGRNRALIATTNPKKMKAIQDDIYSTWNYKVSSFSPNRMKVNNSLIHIAVGMVSIAALSIIYYFVVE